MALKGISLALILKSGGLYAEERMRSSCEIIKYSTIETDEGDILTAKQVKELQKRLAQLEEENLILKKAIAIFTPHSGND